MVLNPAGLAHAAGGKNHLTALVLIDRLGFLAGKGHPKPGKLDGIDSAVQQLQSLLVKVIPAVILKNFRGFHR